MRIVAARACTARWPIASHGAARGRSERAAALLEVCSERGAIGLGEAAPLPGMSLDALDDAGRAIAAFVRRAPLDVVARDALDALAPRMPFVLPDPEAADLLAAAPASARFAIETAVLDALARERGTSIAALLAPARESDTAGAADRQGWRPGSTSSAPHGNDQIAGVPVVPLAAVVDDPVSAQRAFAAGIRCMKIKLNAGDAPGRALAIAAAVPEARLRIDANQSWPRAEVAARLSALAPIVRAIEYVEEPCVDAHLLLAEPLPCRIALDEGLLALTADEIGAALRSPQLAAVVLKPTVLGGFSVALALAALARRCGVAAIASHALEGPIGTAACAELALALGGDHAVGLAAHAALAGWRVEVPQLAADHLRGCATPGLGFVSITLSAALGPELGPDLHSESP